MSNAIYTLRCPTNRSREYLKHAPAMGLFTVIRKNKIREKTVRILVLGLDNAGKSTIIKQVMKEDLSKVAPTFGFEIKTVRYRDFRLDFWDIGGQKSIRPYWQNCFEQTDAVMWVVDSTDIQRLPACRQELFELMTQSRLHFIPLLVLANKQDLAAAKEKAEIEMFLSLHKLKKNRWLVSRTSAYKNKGIDEGIDWLLSQVQKQRS